MPVPAIAAAAVPIAKQLVAKVISKEGAKELLKKFLPFLAKEVAVDGAIHLAGNAAAAGLAKKSGAQASPTSQG